MPPLDQLARRTGNIKRGLPIQLTEFGFETNPPAEPIPTTWQGRHSGVASRWFFVRVSSACACECFETAWNSISWQRRQFCSPR